LFAFVSPVVLIEGLGGRAALRRSVDLVRADWLRVALVVVVFGVIHAVARMLAGAVIPHTAIFMGSLISDLINLVLLPIPIIGAVLLYFDIRRMREGFTDDRLGADLAALKG
jgi:cell shape-determining protein MreD